MTLRRFQAPSCKHFRQTTYTNTSNIDFCRTYNAFVKVFGSSLPPPDAKPHSLVRNRSFQNPQIRCRGAHFLSLRRFQTLPCKHLRKTTYTNTPSITFCRTYNAFVKVFGSPPPPVDAKPHRVVRNRSPLNPQIRCRGGSLFELTTLPDPIL